VTAPANPRRGIDVSRWQGAIAWPSVAASGVCFVYTKATEGSDAVDDRFAANWSGALFAGIARGAYHFLSTGPPAEAQAASFLKTYPGDGELPPALDLERGIAGPGPDAASALRWLAIVRDALGVRPIVYCSPGFAASRLRGEGFEALAEYELWIAHYGVERPTVPAPWTSWRIWQRGLRSIPGVRGPVDEDLFF
jgi:lysozyme